AVPTRSCGAWAQRAPISGLPEMGIIDAQVWQARPARAFAQPTGSFVYDRSVLLSAPPQRPIQAGQDPRRCATEEPMLRISTLAVVAMAAVASLAGSPAAAQEPLKIGISIPMTGAGFNAVGRQIGAAVKLYMAQHGDTVVGRKIEVIMRDD